MNVKVGFDYDDSKLASYGVTRSITWTSATIASGEYKEVEVTYTITGQNKCVRCYSFYNAVTLKIS
jgi:hypothetical protein